MKQKKKSGIKILLKLWTNFWMYFVIGLRGVGGKNICEIHSCFFFISSFVHGLFRYIQIAIIIFCYTFHRLLFIQFILARILFLFSWNINSCLCVWLCITLFTAINYFIIIPNNMPNTLIPIRKKGFYAHCTETSKSSSRTFLISFF